MPEPTNMTTVQPEDLLGPLNEVETKFGRIDLYVVGDQSIFDTGSRVSVVGTRKPTPEGEARCRKLVKALVGKGMVVVSGLAMGIDTIAHTTAIIEGGRTITVLGTGLERCSPKSNTQLLDRIKREHLAVSQFAPGSTTQKHHFPMRNRTMALLSDATVIVEAGETSGTRHQGWEALRLGRPLFLMKSLADRRDDIEWVSEQIKYGATVLSDENLDIILDEMPERSRGEFTF